MQPLKQTIIVMNRMNDKVLVCLRPPPRKSKKPMNIYQINDIKDSFSAVEKCFLALLFVSCLDPIFTIDQGFFYFHA